MTWNDNSNFNVDENLLYFLGEKVVKTLLPKKHSQETPLVADKASLSLVV